MESRIECTRVLQEFLRILWKLMKVVWEKKDSTSISQFNPISLLNVEGKIFFSIITQRLSTYLLKNCFIDTSIQKASLPGFPGCLEHINVIWQQIQSAKKERKELHVTFLDLANAYGLVPHELLWAAFDFFQCTDDNNKFSLLWRFAI